MAKQSIILSILKLPAFNTIMPGRSYYGLADLSEPSWALICMPTWNNILRHTGMILA